MVLFRKKSLKSRARPEELCFPVSRMKTWSNQLVKIRNQNIINSVTGMPQPRSLSFPPQVLPCPKEALAGVQVCVTCATCRAGCKTWKSWPGPNSLGRTVYDLCGDQRKDSLHQCWLGQCIGCYGDVMGMLTCWLGSQLSIP